ncbi:MAG: NAD-dependent epimerase/dehydratase [Roseicyclus sp.]|nr:NAD-dependent epimerase/dehydratase [Roseicyclus sp.]
MTDPKPKPRLLLLGASGRVGRLVARFLDAGANGVIDLVQQRRSGGQGRGELVWGPLDGPDGLLRYLNGQAPFDAFIVLSGITPHSGGLLDDTQKLADACLEAAHVTGTQRVLLASSSAVYDVQSAGPIAEQAALTLTNPYGVAKIQMEQACARWREKGLEICCLRIGNVAGADQLLINVELARRSAPANSPNKIRLDVFDNGRGPQRSYIGPQTLAAVLQALATTPRGLPETLNIAAPQPIWMDDLLIAAGCAFDAVSVAGPHQFITLNCDQLTQFYPFRPEESLPETMVKQWQETL